MRKWLVGVAIVLVGLPILLVAAGLVVFRLSNRTNGVVLSSGERRAYLLYVPASYDPARPTPLVITIHGFAQWPAHQAQISRWNELADRHGFIAVYPQGRGFPLRWRTGSADSPATDPATDVAFIADLITKLEGEYNIDPARIYANGLSNGAGMAFVLSCELSERIAAMGLVAGAYVYPWDACRPGRPVPALVIHGTADSAVPYHGGGSGPLGLLPAIPEWVATLASERGCDGAEDLPAQGEVRGVRYTGCDAEVLFYTVEGGGHTWPGGEPLPVWLAGHTTEDLSASEAMWEFFQAHPLPAR